jgi:hypothetical protein
MGILSGPGEARQIFARDELLEFISESLPACRESLASAAEEFIGDVPCAEGNETAKNSLLISGRVAALVLDLLSQANGFEIVSRAGLPAACERAVAGKTEVPSWDRGC